ncbi:MAG: hypothetical protein QM711_00255 [Micropruina sp.]|uniref:hypothetical protein n=1 Tax=Micropruina sp. TaxID=2737536 RepID=UPI0039E6D898
MFQLFGNAIGQVVAISIIVGAGLPALFAFGVRALAVGSGGSAEVSGEAGKPAMKVVAWIAFALVLAVIAIGLAIIISSGFGYKVSFEHIFPTFIKK